MKRIPFLIGLLLLTFDGFAQTDHLPKHQIEIYKQLSRYYPGAGEVSINQDDKLTEILFNHIELNKQEKGVPLYWIRIYSDSGQGSRQEAYSIKAKFLRKYEGIINDVVYDNPNYKVYVGGYHTKSEALKLLFKIHRDFPTAFIVYDRIIFPELHMK